MSSDNGDWLAAVLRRSPSSWLARQRAARRLYRRRGAEARRRARPWPVGLLGGHR
ncbi:hypothetical protein [Jiangella asiatica]|uniref:hypothetical protein n=1 Tax=Jiangella asiatica TaxID=2530372 RepID=UPI0013A5D5EF|nr:hypothetical protein [Jiangella asiatica]